MTARKTLKSKIGFWIANLSLLLACYLIITSYHELYTQGHIQCTKSRVENSTFLNTTIGMAIFATFFMNHTAKTKRFNAFEERMKKRKFLYVPFILGGIIALIAFMSSFFMIQKQIEKQVERDTLKQIQKDGIKTTAIITESYTRSYQGRGAPTKYPYINFKYKNGEDSISDCYMLEYKDQDRFEVGDTVHFMISKSLPEHIMLAN